ncbi:hypothetical protein AMECASPLE_032743 [Ameca splendens]|uniref:Uncharacterized protein n=1 Tax=Ameca splendens TaxID=208324 RepID=A0ABV1ADZ5_9TELE
MSPVLNGKLILVEFICFCLAEVLYEDLQYLSVTALALMCVAGLLMLTSWLLHRACRRIKVWRHRQQMPGNNATELQPL